MGFRKYENRPLSYHLATPLSIGEMRRRGWVAIARPSTTSARRLPGVCHEDDRRGGLRSARRFVLSPTNQPYEPRSQNRAEVRQTMKNCNEG